MPAARKAHSAGLLTAAFTLVRDSMSERAVALIQRGIELALFVSSDRRADTVRIQRGGSYSQLLFIKISSLMSIRPNPAYTHMGCNPTGAMPCRLHNEANECVRAS